MMKKSLFSALLLALLLLSACTPGGSPAATTAAPAGSDAPTEAGTASAPAEETTGTPVTAAPAAEAIPPEDAFFEGDRYADYLSEQLGIAAGVVGKTNFFAPGQPIPVWVWSGPSLDGQEITVTFSGIASGADAVQTAVLRSDAETRFCFRAARNGLGTLYFEAAGQRFSFSVGVLAKNEQASDEFYYGIQPYVARVMTWGSGSYVEGKDKAASIEAILDTAEWLGVNLVREDGIPWGNIQKSAGAPCDFSAQDELIGYLAAHGMTLDWIISSTPEWAVAEPYRAGTEGAWQKPPDPEAWRVYITAAAAHYASADNVIFEIHNEPDWSFFTGTPEEYFAILETAGRALHAANPNAYVFAGGLAVGDSKERYYKNPALYFAAYKPLLDAGVIDSYAYHIHSGMSAYFTKMDSIARMTAAAGLPGGAINSESGLGVADPGALMVKALYTRARGDRGFVQFSFRKTPKPEGDVDKFAIFSTSLCPTKSAIAYGAMISFLGQSHLEGSAASGARMNIDVYTTKDGKTLAVCYNSGASGVKVNLPAGCTLCDLYGNPKKLPADGSITLTDEPVYALYDTKLDVGAFKQ